MEPRSRLRASDQDRERVAARLHQAALEGRLDADELEERVGAAFGARTYGELDGLLTDLPGPRPSLTPVSVRHRPTLPAVAAGTLAAGVLLTAIGSAAEHAVGRSASAVAGNLPGHRGPGAFYFHPVSGLAFAAPMIGIVFLVLLCAAIGWLFSQRSAPAAES